MCHQRKIQEMAVFKWTGGRHEIEGGVCSLKEGNGETIRQNRKKPHGTGSELTGVQEGKIV